MLVEVVRGGTAVMLFVPLQPLLDAAAGVSGKGALDPGACVPRRPFLLLRDAFHYHLQLSSTRHQLSGVTSRRLASGGICRRGIELDILDGTATRPLRRTRRRISSKSL